VELAAGLAPKPKSRAKGGKSGQAKNNKHVVRIGRVKYLPEHVFFEKAKDEGFVMLNRMIQMNVKHPLIPMDALMSSIQTGMGISYNDVVGPELMEMVGVAQEADAPGAEGVNGIMRN